MHVLMIPSWYASKRKPFGGTFFTDQAESVASQGVKVGLSWAELYPPSVIYKKKVFEFGTRCYKQRGVQYFLESYPKLPEIIKKFKLLNSRLDLYLRINNFNKYVKKFGVPDVVHFQSMYRNASLALWLKEQYNISSVVTEHFSGFGRGGMSDHQQKIYKKAFLSCDSNLVVSKFFGEILKQNYDIDFEVIPNIVDGTFFDLAPFPDENDVFHFAHVAFFNEVKNQVTLIGAFSDAFKGENVMLTLAGNGPERERLFSEAERLGMLKQIKFVGLLNRNQVRDLLHSAHAFVLSSFFETFGVAVIESLSCGRPVVVTRCGGPEEFVGRNDGLLCNVTREDLAKSLVRMRLSWGQFDPRKIREQALSRFSSEVVGCQLLKNYKEVLGYA